MVFWKDLDFLLPPWTPAMFPATFAAGADKEPDSLQEFRDLQESICDIGGSWRGFQNSIISFSKWYRTPQ